MKRTLFSWISCTRAATAIEYALMAGGISLVIVSVVFFAGDRITAIFSKGGSALQSVVSGINDHSAR